MSRILLLFFMVLWSGPAMADNLDDPLVIKGGATELDDFLWLKRPLVVFADNPSDPRFIEQLALIEAGRDELRIRDVIVLTDTDPQSPSALRESLHPRGFAIVLIGKDGTKFLRKPFPWNVREISRVIDKLPLRRQEIRDRSKIRELDG